MVNWLLIAAGVIGLLIVLRLGDVRQKVVTAILVAFFLFLVFTFPLVKSNPEIDFTSLSGVFSLVKVYFSWLKQITGNVISVAGDALKLNWTTNITGEVK